VTEFWVEVEDPAMPTPAPVLPTERWEGDVLPEACLLGTEDKAFILVPELARRGEGGGRGICERDPLAMSSESKLEECPRHLPATSYDVIEYSNSAVTLKGLTLSHSLTTCSFLTKSGR